MERGSRRVRRLVAAALIAVGFALVAFAVSHAVRLRRDQVDLAAAVPCQLPVTGDRSCMYRVDGTVFDVDLTYRNGRPKTQTLWVELDDRATISLEPQRVQPIDVGDRVVVEIWQWRAIAVEHPVGRAEAIWYGHRTVPTIIPGFIGLLLSSWGILMLRQRALVIAFIIHLAVAVLASNEALEGRWETTTAIVAAGWVGSVIVAPRPDARRLHPGNAIKRTKLGPNERLDPAPEPQASPSIVAALVAAGRNPPVVVPRHPVMWRLLLGYAGMIAVIVWLAWATPGWDADPWPRRTGWSAMLLILGLVLAWAWTWRLGRWLLGSLRTARRVRVELLVAHLKWRGAPGSPPGARPADAGDGWAGALWLRVREAGEQPRYQRLAWNRRLVAFALATGAWQAAIPVQARRCPGFRRMLLVEVPGVGRLWPAGTARLNPPVNYDLSRYDPARVGTKYTNLMAGGPSGKLIGGAAFLMLMILMAGLAGPVAAAYLVVLAVNFWLWQGGAPWGGVYSYVPQLVPAELANGGSDREAPKAPDRQARRPNRGGRANRPRRARGGRRGRRSTSGR